MTTLRESLQAEITALESSLAAKKAKLAEHEATYADVLGRDIDALKAFVHSIGAHLFPKTIVSGANLANQAFVAASGVAMPAMGAMKEHGGLFSPPPPPVQ